VLQPDSLKLLGYNFAEKPKIFKFLLFFNIFYAKKMTRGIARVSKLVYIYKVWLYFISDVQNMDSQSKYHKGKKD
jgi:hypothetical protein